MVSRRSALRLAGGTLVALAGCSNREPPTDTPSDSRTPTSSASPSPTDSPTASPTPERPVNWDPEWVRFLRGENVLGVDPYSNRLYLTLELSEGRTAVAEVSPADGQIQWRREFEGTPVDGSFVEWDDDGWNNDGDSGWGVTVTDESVYAITGIDEDEGWSAVHALNRDDGSNRWRFRERDHRQAVRLVTDDTVVVASDEIPPPPSPERPAKPTPGTVRGVATTDGTVRWTASFDPLERVFTGRRTVYALSETELVALAADGKERWRFDTGQPVQEIVEVDGRIYHVAATQTGGEQIRGLSPDGDIAWSRPITVDDAIAGPDGGLLVCGARTLALTTEGRIAWEDLLDSSRPVLGPAGETLYVRSGGEAVAAYALSEGQRLWQYNPPEKYGWPDAATADAVVAEGYADERALYAVSQSTGAATKRLRLRDLNTAFAVEPLDDRVYVGDSRGRLLALDPRAPG